jgi:hypothetical protein
VWQDRVQSKSTIIIMQILNEALNYPIILLFFIAWVVLRLSVGMSRFSQFASRSIPAS